MYTNTKWIVHEHLIRNVLPTGRPNIVDALREQGNEVVVIDYNTTNLSLDDLPTWNDQCVVTYGSVQFVKKVTMLRRGIWRPGAFFRDQNLAYSKFSSYLGDLLLNDDFVILPYGEFKRRGLDVWGGSAFIRPDTASKLFTGFVISDRDFDHEINSLEKLSNLQHEDIIVVASPKKILGEFRFIISEGKVITGCAYSWDKTLDIRSDVHPACYELAEEVSRRDWQADVVYTCDIALTERNGSQEARLLELNAFSCSGLYACDTKIIAKEVSKAAWKEFMGEDL